jgi:hypothetical protein
MNGTTCGRCGTSNDPRAAVCGRCGAGLTASPYVDAIVNQQPVWSQAPYPPAAVPAAAPAFAEANRDAEHLRLIEIGHYILGGLAALVGCFPLIHLAVGIGLLTGGISVNEGEAAIVGGVFIAVAIVIILIAWTLAGCMIAAGRSIKKRRRHTFCQIVAVASCLWMPLGTALGIFTLVVLNRPSVKAMFGKF